jgi:hypothetical protein
MKDANSALPTAAGYRYRIGGVQMLPRYGRPQDGYKVLHALSIINMNLGW